MDETAPHGWRGTALAVALTVVLLTIVLQLWRADPHVPIVRELHGDPLFYQMIVKALVENGGFLDNPRLGMPRGQTLYDYPMADSAHIAVMRLASVLTSDPAAIINAYYLLTFPLTTVAALVALAELGVSFGPALVASVAFSFLPYHFQRGEAHLFLAAYYVVPFAVMVALWLAGDGADESEARPRFAWRRPLVSIAVSLLVGSSGVYYAFFSAFFFAIGGVIGALRQRSSRPLWKALGLGTVLVATLLVNILPSLRYRADDGPNLVAAIRDPFDAERFSLKIAHLVLPVPGHRLRFLANVRTLYQGSFAGPTENENGTASLGAIGTAGFLLLLTHAIVGWPRSRRPRLFSSLAALNVAAILSATMGGFSSLVALFAVPQIRSYNRVSVFIACFALFAVALLLEGLCERWPTAWRRRWSSSAAFAVIAVAAALDQTSRSFVPRYEDVRADYQTSAEFYAALEGALPEGAMIFQLPYLQFYESPPIHHLRDYEPVRGYLQTHRLRWSYGAMKGREADAWQRRWLERPLPELCERLALAGFAGILVDRFGYADEGRSIGAELQAILSVAPRQSTDDRLAFFDLQAFAATRRRGLGEAEFQRLKRETLE